MTNWHILPQTLEKWGYKLYNNPYVQAELRIYRHYEMLENNEDDDDDDDECRTWKSVTKSNKYLSLLNNWEK